MDIKKLLNALKSAPSEQYESEIVEFKNYADERALHNSKDLVTEISALSNTKGGEIIIGVIDSSDIPNHEWKKQLNGFPKTDLDILKERICGKINPKIEIKVEEIYFESKNYLVLHIPNVKHSLVTTSSGKTYIRIGKSSLPANPQQIHDLVKNLQSYDWSSEDVISDKGSLSLLNSNALKEAKLDFCKRRKIDVSSMSNANFLEAIGATKNGILNKGGLLFLGKTDSIIKILGLYEYRFSWRTDNGNLKINEVWSDCIWNSIKVAKKYFSKCNESIEIFWEKTSYELNTLDEQAFHEAYLNSIVHRDYSIDGMNVVNFKGNEIIITNPGSFYGGVNSENISYHEPRHRNKILAKILMDFQLVDRAGMGVLRMGLNSLKYGRKFPSFRESNDNIEVTMEASYFKDGVFVLTQKYLPDCGIVELYIVNKLFNKGAESISLIENKLSKIVKDTWKQILNAIDKKDFKHFFELKGNYTGVYICPVEMIHSFFKIEKPFNASPNSDKHVNLYKFLKEYGAASNKEIMAHLGFGSPSSTFQFLAKCMYLENFGKGRSSRWRIKSN